MRIGYLYLFVPFECEYNSERNSASRLGIYLGKKNGSWTIPQYVVLSSYGVENLWTNRWAAEVV